MHSFTCSGPARKKGAALSCSYPNFTGITDGSTITCSGSYPTDPVNFTLVCKP
jgi:hypothetical protein